MSKELANLIKKIEYLRTLLYSLICNKDLTNPDVITCSQELDKLIVDYELLRLNIPTAA
ncbi:aspartyl-phosphate phosphatase Spo0E family protein [Clostridium hydrogenum]|uniref:aspartyl-phosphate phosphatase Spo0E family protein n=1 Tax=Clostridium hydrogenum TaxID=2855764 RepID=UPI001F26E946|nr:aspartyl-phosphate phosphatase Spo0E family protein [Clostridium hydrogenum]